MDIAASPIAALILVITVGISLYGLYANPQLIDKWVLRPYDLIHRKQWHTVLTSGFIHADIGHLFFNMFSFYFFAFTLEARIGSLRFLILYIVSMVLADITTILKHRDHRGYSSLGASGAVAGVLFSFILLFPYAELMIFPIPYPIPSPIFAILYLAYCYYAGRKAVDMINHEAHFWGALAGLILTTIMAPEALVAFFDYLI